MTLHRSGAIARICFVVTAALILMTLACLAQTDSSVMWVDFDMKNIPEPKARDVGYYDVFFKGEVVERLKQQMDVPRWARLAAGHPKPAMDVNAVDEVPNSSWYTNRHRFHRMTAAELQRGPNTGHPPDFTTATITRAKTGGVMPGMTVKDSTGQSYLVKFDSVLYPNLNSAAEVISTKILYAAGYNVPENYIAYIDPKAFRIEQGVKILDPASGKPRPLAPEDLEKILEQAARAPDGRYRVMASRILQGKPKGPFTQVGLRLDDPNDWIPHEHRRELRALRVISSWINNWDLKEGQSLDMYVEEGGRKFLRHYLLDFGSSLGGGLDPREYFHGHEYGLDAKSIGKEIVTLGIYTSANEKRARIISPELGGFTSFGFDPANWKPTYPSVMFSNLTDQDAFWAVRIILSFTEADIRSIVQTAEFSNPASVDYVVDTLMERRRKLAQYWLGRVDALSDFSIKRAGAGVRLDFTDLMAEQKLADASAYTYQVKSRRYKSPQLHAVRPDLLVDPDVIRAAAGSGGGDNPIEVRIWTRRGNSTSKPVTIYFNWSPGSGPLTIRRVARG